MNELKKIGWSPTDAQPEFIKPEFARWKLNYNAAYNKDGTPNMNRKGYTPHWSWDWNNKTNMYDEMWGVKRLIERMILEKPPQATGWAKLYVTFALQPDTNLKIYDYCVGFWKGHVNIYPTYKPKWMRTENNGLKLHITESILAYRAMKEIQNMIKLKSTLSPINV